jgi:hypothetical protein
MALQRVDARLESEWSGRIVRPWFGNASIAYGRTDTGELLTGTCLSAGVQLERSCSMPW